MPGEISAHENANGVQALFLTGPFRQCRLVCGMLQRPRIPLICHVCFGYASDDTGSGFQRQQVKRCDQYHAVAYGCAQLVWQDKRTPPSSVRKVPLAQTCIGFRRLVRGQTQPIAAAGVALVKLNLSTEFTKRSSCPASLPQAEVLAFPDVPFLLRTKDWTTRASSCGACLMLGTKG